MELFMLQQINEFVVKHHDKVTHFAVGAAVSPLAVPLVAIFPVLSLAAGAIISATLVGAFKEALDWYQKRKVSVPDLLATIGGALPTALILLGQTK
jgi:hypothetical protein